MKINKPTAATAPGNMYTAGITKLETDAAILLAEREATAVDAAVEQASSNPANCDHDDKAIRDEELGEGREQDAEFEAEWEAEAKRELWDWSESTTAELGGLVFPAYEIENKAGEKFAILFDDSGPDHVGWVLAELVEYGDCQRAWELIEASGIQSDDLAKVWAEITIKERAA